jgi:hypothetical protein
MGDGLWRSRGQTSPSLGRKQVSIATVHIYLLPICHTFLTVSCIPFAAHFAMGLTEQTPQEPAEEAVDLWSSGMATIGDTRPLTGPKNWVEIEAERAENLADE